MVFVVYPRRALSHLSMKNVENCHSTTGVYTPSLQLSYATGHSDIECINRETDCQFNLPVPITQHIYEYIKDMLEDDELLVEGSICHFGYKWKK